MPRINRELVQKREAFVYKQFSLDPPREIAEVQKMLKDPKQELGGMEMNIKRIYEIRKAVEANKLGSPTATARKPPVAASKTSTDKDIDVFVDPEVPVPLMMRFGKRVSQVGTVPLRMLVKG